MSRRPAKPAAVSRRAVPVKPAPSRVVLITGLSGAGRSSALKTLEDFGYEAVDNLPLSLLGSLVAPPRRGAARPRALAIGVDIRTRDFGVAPFLDELERLRARRDLAVHLLFLDSSDEALLRRYTETRRRHPLAVDRPVRDGIGHERRLLGRLRERADRVIDTTDYAPGDLRRVLKGHYDLGGAARLAVSVVSFSYAHGLPREADLVFDVRFLRNPNYVPALKARTDQDEAVGAYVAADAGFAEFFAAMTRLLGLLLPRFEQEGKSYLTIAVGCTGGRHRSVYVAERIAAWLRERGRDAAAVHRDMPAMVPAIKLPRRAQPRARA